MLVLKNCNTRLYHKHISVRKNPQEAEYNVVSCLMQEHVHPYSTQLKKLDLTVYKVRMFHVKHSRQSFKNQVKSFQVALVLSVISNIVLHIV